MGTHREEDKHADKQTGTEQPVTFQLMQNQPNPFWKQTTIRFYMPRSGHVKLKVLSTDKRVINMLYQGDATQGWHSVTWNGKDREGEHMGEGNYQYRLEAGGFVAIRTLEIKM